jgi:hypothetical protein
MKPITLLLCLICFVSSSFAQQVNVPLEVQKNQKQRYPVNKVLAWKLIHDQYEAEMDIAEVPVKVTYDKAGQWLFTETKIESSDLPSNVVQFLQTNFQGQEITYSSKVSFADGTLNFKTTVNQIKLIFDAMGRLIRKDLD